MLYLLNNRCITNPYLSKMKNRQYCEIENTASTMMGLYATKRILHTHEFRKTNMISIQYLCSFYTLYLCKYNFRMLIGETADDTRLKKYHSWWC